MRNYLANKRFYLSGPIQFNNDSKNWRTDVVKVLREEFQIEVFDPFDDPKQQWSEPLKAAQAKKDYDEMARIAKMFVRKDLSLVDRSDAVISYVPYKVPTFGTTHEIINSVNAKKPTILVSESKEKVPLWFYGFVPHEFMFGSWEEAFQYLREINDNKHLENNRWDFIRDKI